MCVHMSGEDLVLYVCDVLYAVLHVRVSYFVVRGCDVSRRYIHVSIVICLVLLMCTLTICSSVLCVLMVEGMSIVVNVMLYVISEKGPPPAFCKLSTRTVVKLCTLGVFVTKTYMLL